MVVDGLSFAKTKLDSLSPLTKDIATNGVRAVLTGGTGPLISIAVNQGAGKALEFVPKSLLRPIAEAGAKLDKFVGDGGSSFLLSKDFTAVSGDNSSGTRSDSSATTFGVTTLFGVSLAPIVNKAKALFKADTPDVVQGNANLGDLKGADPFQLPVVPLDRSKISTAKPGQSAVPRDLNEQVLFNRVLDNPRAGKPLELNNDPRFKASDGFQKMEAIQTLPDGKKIIIHYQYDTKTGKTYDLKFTTPQRTPPVLQPGPSIRK